MCTSFPPTLTMVHLCITQCTYRTPLDGTIPKLNTDGICYELSVLANNTRLSLFFTNLERCISIYLPISRFTCCATFLSIHLSIDGFIHKPIDRSIYSFICPSTHLFIQKCGHEQGDKVGGRQLLIFVIFLFFRFPRSGPGPRNQQSGSRPQQLVDLTNARNDCRPDEVFTDHRLDA